VAVKLTNRIQHSTLPFLNVFKVDGLGCTIQNGLEIVRRDRSQFNFSECWTRLEFCDVLDAPNIAITFLKIKLKGVERSVSMT
jgi:hypothetical protein